MSKSSVSLRVRCSIVSFTGLPEADRTLVCNLVMKRNDRDSNFEKVFVKNIFPLTRKTNEWEEVTVTDLYSYINSATKLKHVDTTEIDTTEIWNILICLDIEIPPLTAYSPHILPRALVTCVVDDFCKLKKSFEEYEQHRDDSSLQYFDNLYLFKNFISANCLKEASKEDGLFDVLRMSKSGHFCNMYTAFVGTYQGEKPVETETIDNGLKCMLDDINCPNEVDPLSTLHLGNCKLLFSINTNKNCDTIAGNLYNQMDRRLSEQMVYKIPVVWLMLLLELKQLCITKSINYISFTEVFEKIWKQNSIELSAALKLFSKLGILYYLESSSYSDGYIFCNWNWLFKILSNFMKKNIPGEIGTYRAHNLFVYEGILNQKMISDASQLFGIELKLLIQLLLRFRLAVPLHRSTVQSTEYFIPYRLPVIKNINEILSVYGNLQLAPVLMTFSKGTLHPSLIFQFAGYLLENLPDYWSQPRESSEKRQYTFSNLITFPVGSGYSVTLCYKVFYLEIQIRKINDCKSDADFTLNTVTTAFRNACRSFKGNKSNICCGFLCAICKYDHPRHMMMLSKENTKRAYCCKKMQKFPLRDEWYAAWFKVCSTVCWYCNVCIVYVRIYFLFTCIYLYVFMYVCTYVGNI